MSLDYLVASQFLILTDCYAGNNNENQDRQKKGRATSHSFPPHSPDGFRGFMIHFLAARQQAISTGSLI
jgi:hypothetical protein